MHSCQLIGTQTLKTLHLDMPKATGEPSSVAAIGVRANSLQPTRRGCYTTSSCMQRGIWVPNLKMCKDLPIHLHDAVRKGRYIFSPLPFTSLHARQFLVNNCLSYFLKFWIWFITEMPCRPYNVLMTSPFSRTLGCIILCHVHWYCSPIRLMLPVAVEVL